MRVALISIAGRDGENPFIAGKSRAVRQVEFALAAGSTRILAFGQGSSADAIDIRYVTERGGARFQAVHDAHGLLGTVSAGDEILILSPDLLPESHKALDLLGCNPCILVLPAQPGVSAGFERIDADWAWAGAMVAPGTIVERLAELPPEIEPAGALLRIGLQARLAKHEVAEADLSEGHWVSLTNDVAISELERAWLKRNAPRPPLFSFTSHLGALAVERIALAFDQRKSARIALAAALLLAVFAPLLAYLGQPWAGFLALGIAWLLLRIGDGLRHLYLTPFVHGARRQWLKAAPALLHDFCFLAASWFAFEGEWKQHMFPSLVLVLALHAPLPEKRQAWVGLLGDRLTVGMVLAAAAIGGVLEAAMMALGLALIGLRVPISLPARG